MVVFGAVTILLILALLQAPLHISPHEASSNVFQIRLTLLSRKLSVGHGSAVVLAISSGMILQMTHPRPSWRRGLAGDSLQTTLAARYVAYFSSIERGIGLVGSGSIPARTSSTKRRIMQSLMLLTRLFSGLFRPEDQLPVILAPQGIGASVKLIRWEGSIVAAPLNNPRFLPIPCQSCPYDSIMSIL